MMRAAVVVGESVVNVVMVADLSWRPAEGVLVPSDTAGPGWRYVDGEFIAPDPTPEPPLTWDDIRRERDALLAASDWTQVADAPVDAASWAVYRQALRDVPQDFATPDEVVWPTPPA